MMGIYLFLVGIAALEVAILWQVTKRPVGSDQAKVDALTARLKTIETGLKTAVDTQKKGT